MFSHIQPEVLDRIFQVKVYLQESTRIRSMDALKTAKGLVFVQLYAVYEYTITESFTAAIRTISAFSIPANNIKPCILSIAFDNNWDSLKDLKKQRSWNKRMEILSDARSNLAINIQDDVFPSDGSHFRAPQIQTIWNVLGISTPIVSNSIYLGRIQEVVEHRNAIAHGRDTANNIGGRFTEQDLIARIRDFQNICLHIVDTLESYCNSEVNFRAM